MWDKYLVVVDFSVEHQSNNPRLLDLGALADEEATVDWCLQQTLFSSLVGTISTGYHRTSALHRG